jgi:hypothetical protein
MAYTDGLVVIESADNAENGAATATPTAFGSGLATLASTDVETICPGGATIEDFLVYPRSAAGGSDATRPVFALHTGLRAGGVSTEVLTITAAAAVAQGARVRAGSPSLPINIPAGGYFKFVKKTAAGAGTVVWRAAVILRNSGKAVADSAGGANSPLTSVTI